MISSSILTDVEKIVGSDNWSSCDFLDNSHPFPFPDQYDKLLVRPKNTNEVASLMKMCNKYSLSMTVKGGGTSVVGGSHPVQSQLVLSMERMNAIESINILDRSALVESGVVTGDLQNLLSEHNLFLPPNPGSSKSCFIGGNIAVCAAGAKSAKYGTFRDYVLNLEVVLPNGEVIWTGADATKSAQGINLTHLFIGSEGILGVITRALLRVVPTKELEYTIAASFPKVENSINAINEIVKQGFTPSSIEILYDYAFLKAKESPSNVFSKSNPSHTSCIIVEVEGVDVRAIESQVTKISEIIQRFTNSKVIIAKDVDESRKITELRKNVVDFLQDKKTRYREIDICISRSRFIQYINGVKEIGQALNLKMICFGHAMDGNLHIMILLPDNFNSAFLNTLDTAVDRIYSLGRSLGGAVSGEHGIGHLQREYLRMSVPKANYDLLKAIKVLFDPNNLLNPQKVYL